MDGDEIRLIERRSRMVAHELRAKRIEMGRIDTELRGVKQRIEKESTQFSSIKEILLNVGRESAPVLQSEALVRASALAGTLRQMQDLITRQRGELAALNNKRTAAEVAAAKLDCTAEALLERKDGIRKRIEGVTEELASEEQHEIYAIKRAEEVSHAARKESHDPQEKEVRHVQPISHAVSHGETPSEPPGAPQFNLQFDPNQRQQAFYEQTQQECQSIPAAQPGRESRSFSSALSAAQRDQVEALTAWERLGERGIQFQLSLGARRELGVEIVSHAEGGVRVLLEPGAARDSRALQAARSAIGQALSEQGCMVKEIVIRGRERR